jgi:RNA polymerase sigma-70 factor (ECF subfamily)
MDVDDIAVLAAPDASPEVLAERRQIVALSWSALDRIKPKKRIAFILRVVEEMSLEEIGALVGARVATVAKRVEHAQVELHRMLERQLRERPAHGGEETS